MWNKKAGRALAIAAAAGSLLVGGTFAYLTDYDQTVNQFTVGKVTIDLEEPNWKPEENTKIVPTQVIKKDPQIKNTGKNDAFVYLEVSVPMANVIAADPAGNRTPQKKQELLSYKKNDGWTQMDTRTVGDNQVYTYVYNKILEPLQTTSTLFDTVTFANVIEGQLDTRILEMPIRAYAIQTENTGGSETDIVKKAIVAYDKYVNQNQGQAGKVTR